MSASDRWRLRVEVALWHHGIGLWIAALLVALAAGLYAGWVRPTLDAVLELQARSAAHADALRARPATAPRSSAEALSASWSERLPPSAGLDLLQSDLYAQAQAQSVRTIGAQYQIARDPVTQLWRASLSLEMTGGYPAIRRMWEALLRRHPNLALDSFGLGRPSEDAETRVQVQATAWFSDARSGETPPSLLQARLASDDRGAR